MKELLCTNGGVEKRESDQRSEVTSLLRRDHNNLYLLRNQSERSTRSTNRILVAMFVNCLLMQVIWVFLFIFGYFL